LIFFKKIIYALKFINYWSGRYYTFSGFSSCKCYVDNYIGALVDGSRGAGSVDYSCLDIDGLDCGENEGNSVIYFYYGCFTSSSEEGYGCTAGLSDIVGKCYRDNIFCIGRKSSFGDG
jgi:hypothetical protein